MKSENLQKLRKISQDLKPIDPNTHTYWRYGDFLEWHAKQLNDEIKTDLKRIRLQINMNQNLGILELSFQDGKKISYWVNANKLTLIQNHLKELGAKSWNVYLTMGRPRLDWSDLTKHYNKQIVEEYKRMHQILIEQLRDNLQNLAQNNSSIDTINIIDAGCGRSPALIGNAYQLVKEFFPNTPIHALGFDYEKKNIEVCNTSPEKPPHIVFIQGDLNDIQRIIQLSPQLARPDPHTYTIMISSGSMTRFVLNDAFENMRVIKEAWRAPVQEILMTGERELLFNERMLHRMGFTLGSYAPGVEGLSPVVNLKRLSEEEMIKQIKEGLQRKPHHLDLSLCPMPEKILAAVMSDPNIADKIASIVLSFSDITDLPHVIKSLAGLKNLNHVTYHHNLNPAIIAQLRKNLGSDVSIKGLYTNNELYLLGSEKYFQRSGLSLNTAEDNRIINVFTKHIEKVWPTANLADQKFLSECYQILARLPPAFLKETTNFNILSNFIFYLHRLETSGKSKQSKLLPTPDLNSVEQMALIEMFIKANKADALTLFLAENNLKLADILQQHNDFIFTAINFESVDILRLMKNNNIDPHIIEPDTLMHHAIRNNKSQSVSMLGKLWPTLMSLKNKHDSPVIFSILGKDTTKASLLTIKALFDLNPDLSMTVHGRTIWNVLNEKKIFSIKQAGIDIAALKVDHMTILEKLLCEQLANLSEPWCMRHYNLDDWFTILSLLQESSQYNSHSLLTMSVGEITKQVPMKEAINQIVRMLCRTFDLIFGPERNELAKKVLLVADKYEPNLLNIIYNACKDADIPVSESNPQRIR